MHGSIDVDADRVRLLIAARQLTQEQVADLAEVSQAHVQRMTAISRRYRWTKVLPVAQVLDCSLEDMGVPHDQAEAVRRTEAQLARARRELARRGRPNGRSGARGRQGTVKSEKEYPEHPRYPEPLRYSVYPDYSGAAAAG